MKKAMLLSLLLQFIFCCGGDAAKPRFERRDFYGFDNPSILREYCLLNSSHLNYDIKKISLYAINPEGVDLWKHGRMILRIEDKNGERFSSIYIPKAAMILDETEKEDCIIECLEGCLRLRFFVETRCLESACDQAFRAYKKFNAGSVLLPSKLVVVQMQQKELAKRGCF